MLRDVLEGKPLRHPIHPMLVHFPIGFFILSFLLDIVFFAFPAATYLVLGSFYAMTLGVATALLAAVPGFVDYTDIRVDHPAKRIATAHMALNLMMVAIYVFDLVIRWSTDVDSKVPFSAFVLSFVGIGLISASGYLGGQLVYHYGVGVGRHKRHMPPPRNTIHVSTPVSGADVVFVPIPAAQQLRERETLRVDLDGQVMAIVRLDNQLFAFQEFCTHRFGPLSEGHFAGFNVECPWHNSCFDVRTGKVTNGPAKIDLKTFRVETRDGKIGIVLSKQS